MDSSSGDTAADATQCYLAVDTRQLRSDDELRRIFGGGLAAGAARQRGTRQHLRSRGGVLVRAKDSWPPYTGGAGLSMTTSGSMFCYTRSTAWHAAQAEYSMCVNSGDPHRLLDMLRKMPYHVGALLQMSELRAHTNDAAESAELLERALYALEIAWHPSFAGALRSGTARMDGSLPENAPFFDALFRHINLLGRKGCVRTALECCKLLLSLDVKDPKGIVQCIDYYALRADEHTWLLHLGPSYRDGSLCSLPSTAYSLALAAWSAHKHKACEEYGDTADARLRDAMLLHPLALVRLVHNLSASNALSIDADWSVVLDSPPFLGADAGGSSTLTHLTDLFVERHHALWRPEAVQSWMKACAKAVVSDSSAHADWALLRQQAFPQDGGVNAYSHLMVSNFSDAAVRALPPEDNPFLRPPQREPEPDMNLLVDLLAHLPGDQQEELQALAQGAAGGAGVERNALRLFLETMFRPQAGGGAGPAAEGAEGILREPGDSDDERDTDWLHDGDHGAESDEDSFEEVPAQWRAEWDAMREGRPAQQQPDWDTPD